MLWIVVGVVVVVALGAVVVYNRLVSLRQSVSNAQGDIDVQLRQRADLVPQLVETVKGYAAHEAGVLETLTKARTAVTQAATPDQKMAAEGGLSRAIGGLFAVAEAYPDLKASATMAQLSEELSSTENRVAFARQAYNDAVMGYNVSRESFPGNVVAGSFSFTEAAPYDAANEVERAPVRVAF